MRQQLKFERFKDALLKIWLYTKRSEEQKVVFSKKYGTDLLTVTGNNEIYIIKMHTKIIRGATTRHTTLIFAHIACHMHRCVPLSAKRLLLVVVNMLLLLLKCLKLHWHWSPETALLAFKLALRESRWLNSNRSPKRKVHPQQKQYRNCEKKNARKTHKQLVVHATCGKRGEKCKAAYSV